MKLLRRLVVPVAALFMLVPSSHAASSLDEQRRPWLGVMLASGGPSSQGGDATEPGTEPAGVLVGAIFEGSPADDARLRSKDVIVAVDGVAVGDAAGLLARLRDVGPGGLVTLSVKRSGRELELRTVLGTRPDRSDRGRIIRGFIGIDAIELPASLREHFGAPEDAGVLVSLVVPGSPAERSGIQVGDVVYEADGERVTSAEALSQIVSQAGVENVIDVVLARDGARIVVGPQIERAP